MPLMIAADTSNQDMVFALFMCLSLAVSRLRTSRLIGDILFSFHHPNHPLPSTRSFLSTPSLPSHLLSLPLYSLLPFLPLLLILFLPTLPIPTHRLSHHPTHHPCPESILPSILPLAANAPFIPPSFSHLPPSIPPFNPQSLRLPTSPSTPLHRAKSKQICIQSYFYSTFLGGSMFVRW